MRKHPDTRETKESSALSHSLSSSSFFTLYNLLKLLFNSIGLHSSAVSEHFLESRGEPILERDRERERGEEENFPKEKVQNPKKE